jgi:hypothetical protein
MSKTVQLTVTNLLTLAQAALSTVNVKYSANKTSEKYPDICGVSIKEVQDSVDDLNTWVTLLQTAITSKGGCIECEVKYNVN